MKKVVLLLLLGVMAGCKPSQSVSTFTADDQATASAGQTEHTKFSGKHHSHHKQKEIEKNSNFNLKQAQAIVSANIENKEDHVKHASKRRERMMQMLHSLNFVKRSESKKKRKVPYEFY